KAWSEAILTHLGAPLTSANIVSIGYWMQNEAGSPPSGIVGANNPFNVSQACCGGVPIQDDGDGVTFLQSYPTVADGLEAITEYLNRGNDTAILADLKAGVGLRNDPNLASEISLYSGGGYSTIPDSWRRSQLTTAGTLRSGNGSGRAASGRPPGTPRRRGSTPTASLPSTMARAAAKLGSAA